MKPARRAANASGLLAVSLAVVSACRFARNIILARMLMPEDFGIGATFTLSVTFFELLTELGPAKQLIQAKHGYRPIWMGVAHTVLAARGLLIAVVLFAAAGPISTWFGAPDTRFAFQILALAPLLRGFEHCDICRYQRHMRFSALAWVEAAPAVLSFLVAPLAGYLLPDYRAFLVVTIVWAASRLAISHLVASRPYRLGFNEELFRRFFGFGWPLLGNSLLLFLILHGERLVVALQYNLATLGDYSVALALGFAPTMMFTKLHSSVTLPIISKARHKADDFRRAVAGSSQVVSLAAGLVSIAFVVAGSWLVGLCYGEKYLLSQEVIPWIGLMCAMRVVRSTASMMSVSSGDTRILLYSNLARVAFFGVAAWLAYSGWAVVWMPICGFAGELTGYLFSLVLLKHRHNAPVEESLKCFLGVACVVGLVAAAHLTGVTASIPAPLTACLGGVVLFAFAWSRWGSFRDSFRSVVLERLGAPAA